MPRYDEYFFLSSTAVDVSTSIKWLLRYIWNQTVLVQWGVKKSPTLKTVVKKFNGIIVN